MAITLVGTAATTAGGGAGATTNSSGVTTLPSGLASGDLLILHVGRSYEYVLSSGTPTGYTFLRNIFDAGTTPAGAQTDIFYKICTGSEGTSGPTFTTGAGARWCVQAAAYRGVSTTLPFIDENGATETATTTSHAAPAITNTVSGAWGVYAAAARAGATPQSWTPPTGMTERLDTDLGVAGSTNLVTTWADTNGSVAASTVTYTGTGSTTAPIATMWAAFLRPIAAPPNPPTGLIASPVSTSQINLSWTEQTGATGYDIERDGVVIASDVVGDTYNDTGLAAATTYTYRARSVGA